MKIAQLSKGEIDKVISLCLKTNVKRIYITGGEPFLSSNIWYLLESCSKNKITVEDITTNGTLLDTLGPHEIDLINKTVLDIIISIDSSEENKHDESRGVKGTYLKISNFLNNAKKRNLFKCSFSFNVVLHSGNIKDLKPIIDLAISWQVRHINFQPISPVSIFTDMNTIKDKSHFVNNLSLEYFKKEADRLIMYSGDNKVSTNLPVLKTWIESYFKHLDSKDIFFKFIPLRFLCSKVFNYIHINYNGDLVTCVNLKAFANINDRDCFKKWQENSQKLKELFKKGKYFDSCRFCFCDFPINMRISMLYFPLVNIIPIFKLLGYYWARAGMKGGIPKG